MKNKYVLTWTEHKLKKFRSNYRIFCTCKALQYNLRFVCQSSNLWSRDHQGDFMLVEEAVNKRTANEIVLDDDKEVRPWVISTHSDIQENKYQSETLIHRSPPTDQLYIRVVFTSMAGVGK